MNPATFRFLAAVLLATVAMHARAATHSENFESASGNANAFNSASGMYFSSSGASFAFGTTFNSYFSPYIAGKFINTGCNGCFAGTTTVSFPSAQRSLVFGWGTQGYAAVRVTAYRAGQQVWQVNQSGTASNGLYKQQFSHTAASAAEYFDQVAITFPGGGQAGTGYGVLLDNFTSADAFAPLILSGSYQVTPVSNVYASPLIVVVHDYQNHPVAGVTVDFQAPADGQGAPTGLFDATNDVFDTAVTDADGIAISSNLTANGVEGRFTVQATATPSIGSATFQLTNLSADTIFAFGFE